jgi:hypothetical protein
METVLTDIIVALQSLLANLQPLAAVALFGGRPASLVVIGYRLLLVEFTFTESHAIDTTP